MPEAVGVNGVPERREVEELEAHGETEPGDDEAGGSCPELLEARVVSDGEVRPDEVRDGADGDVGSHVVRVGPADKRKVVHMRSVQGEA